MEALIFVSHRESDSAIAAALVEVLLGNISVPEEAVRCTSVPGFQLPFGVSISEQLKSDIGRANAVFVLITPAALQSRWVLFELGAAWALGKVVVPVLGSGISEKQLPGPVSEYPVIRIDAPDAGPRLRDAIVQVATALVLPLKLGGRGQAKLDLFIDQFRNWRAAIPASVDAARAFQIGWLLVLLLVKQADYPAAVEVEIDEHAAALGLTLPAAWIQSLRNDDGGEAFQRLIEKIGGQITARRPNLIHFFQAAYNLAAHGWKVPEAQLAELVEPLGLPSELRKLSSDRLSWINAVHTYFAEALRAGAG